MDLQEEVIVVEKELLDVILSHVEEGKIDLPTAKKQAQEFLAQLPFQDKKDLLQKLKELGAKYEEIQEVYVEEWSKDSTKERDIALLKMRDAIKQGNIDHAINTAKTVTGGM